MKTNTIILNGKPVDAVVFGDGQQQIDFFNTLAEYANGHNFQFMSRLQNSQWPGMVDTIVLASSDKSDIRVTETKIPGARPPFDHARYRFYVKDKEANQTQSGYGTISHYIWDLMQEVRNKQK